MFHVALITLRDSLILFRFISVKFSLSNKILLKFFKPPGLSKNYIGPTFKFCRLQKLTLNLHSSPSISHTNMQSQLPSINHYYILLLFYRFP